MADAFECGKMYRYAHGVSQCLLQRYNGIAGPDLTAVGQQRDVSVPILNNLKWEGLRKVTRKQTALVFISRNFLQNKA